MNVSKINSFLLGVAVGDAVGVPYEFRYREIMLKKPATDMV
jgi:ADP-ribosylglycohydrolase